MFLIILPAQKEYASRKGSFASCSDGTFQEPPIEQSSFPTGRLLGARQRAAQVCTFICQINAIVYVSVAKDSSDKKNLQHPAATTAVIRNASDGCDEVQTCNMGGKKIQTSLLKKKIGVKKQRCTQSWVYAAFGD